MALSRTSSSLLEDDVGNSTVIAIDKDKNSQFAVKWAVDNLLSNSYHCILVYVRNQSLHHHDFEAVPKEGRPPNEAELQQLFLPYRGFCARKGIEAREVILHDIEITSALIDYIAHNSISNVVVGASNRNAFTRKFRDADVPSSLIKSAPASCAVYVISKGKVQAVRPAARPQTSTGTAANPGQRSQREVIPSVHPDTQDPDDTNRTSIGPGRWRSTSSDKLSFDRSSDSLLMTPQNNFRSSSRTSSPTLSMDGFTTANSSQINSDSSEPFSSRSNDASSDNLESSVASGSPRSPRFSQTPVSTKIVGPHFFIINRDDDYLTSAFAGSLAGKRKGGLEAEKRRLRIELKQTMEMYKSACKEAIAARQKARELQQWKKLEGQRLEESKFAEEAALALAKVERHKTKAALEAAKMQQRLAEMETRRRKNAEMQAKQDAEEKKRAMNTLAHNNVRYRRYAIEEIEEATDHFNSSLKIGEGGYGPVYKGLLDHTAVAIKMLRPDLSQGQQQFQREIEVLSCIRHPHMVILLGACPEYGCLVYEYMDNGSLEDRLFRKDNTPPIPWSNRFKIAAEISTSLLFLHQTKPEPIVHRDLKPANILLDRNYLSKISDVGLARLVPPSVADSVSQYHMTAAAGTFCYIDPEYQQTGLLGVKSDIYSLGLILLQVITARPPIGLAHQVGEAIEKETFSEMLDPTVTDWPIEEALSLAKLALKCCEMRKRDRPDLGSVLLPELDRLRDLGSVYWSIKNQRIANEPRPYDSVPEVGSTVNQDEPNVEIEIQRRSV